MARICGIGHPPTPNHICKIKIHFAGNSPQGARAQPGIRIQILEQLDWIWWCAQIVSNYLMSSRNTCREIDTTWAAFSPNLSRNSQHRIQFSCTWARLWIQLTAENLDMYVDMLHTPNKAWSCDLSVISRMLQPTELWELRYAFADLGIRQPQTTFAKQKSILLEIRDKAHVCSPEPEYKFWNNWIWI